MSNVKSVAENLRGGVYVVAADRPRVNRKGQLVTLLPGQTIPEAAKWDRAAVDLTRGRLLRLSPEACVEIVREALRADPSLAEELRGAADPGADAGPVADQGRKDKRR